MQDFQTNGKENLTKNLLLSQKNGLFTRYEIPKGNLACPM
jgi:hypothetical protein